jgi:hypothetical protein
MKNNLHQLLMLACMALPLGLFAQITDLIISEYGEGSSNNKYMELYNGTGADVDMSNYVMWKITNDGNWWERDFPLGGILPDGATYLMVNPDADPALLALADTVGPVSPTFFLFNGNEAFALCKIMSPGDTVIIDVIGMESGTTVPENWDVAGVVGAGAEHTWVRKKTVCSPNASWASSAGTNAENSEWIVYDQDYWANAAMHEAECVPPVAEDLFFSEYGEGSSNNKYMEIYNGTGEDVDLSNYVMWKIINDGNWWERDFPMTGILADGETYLMVNPDADVALLGIADTVGPVSPTFFLFNGNEAFALAKIMAPGDTVIIDVIGVESGTTVPENWDVAGVVGAGAEHTWIRKPSVCKPNASWASSAGTNAENSEWIVYDQDYWADAGMHTMTCKNTAVPEVPVTFKVDMSQETVSPDGVHILGSFQGYDPGATPMTDANSDQIYEVTLLLPANGAHEYKFVNGNTGAGEESVPAPCASGLYRPLMTDSMAVNLDVVCFGACTPCAGQYAVTFRVDMSQETVSANGVHIIGSFQGFDPTATPMDDSDGDKIYEYTTVLGGNTAYQYKFVNGMSFGLDETVPSACAMNNNRVLNLGFGPLVTDAFCFGSCEACTSPTRDLLLDQSLWLFPNPNDGHFEIQFDLPGYREMTINVRNTLGQVLESQTGIFQTGQNRVSFDLQAKGLFVVEFSSVFGRIVRRVVVE